MCPLGDPNSGSSGMCLCVGMWRAEGGGPGGGGCGLWNACPCVRHCLGSCVVSKLYERGAPSYTGTRTPHTQRPYGANDV